AGRRPAQGLRHRRHRRHRPGGRDGRVRLRLLPRGHGPVGIREVDAAALPGRARQRRQRPGARRGGLAGRHERQAADGPAPRPRRLRLPAVQPAADPDGRGEHPAPARHRGPLGRPGLVRPGRLRRRTGRPPQPPPDGAVRRPAAAGRLRAGADHPSRRGLRRRAHRQPRLQERRGGAGLPAAQRARVRPDGGHGDARPERRRVRRPRRLPGGRPARRPDAGSDDRARARPDEGLRQRGRGDARQRPDRRRRREEAGL
ncbi:MAG: ABC transporter, ATP-binding protein, partial [uncultured Frankineae bacterium]